MYLLTPGLGFHDTQAELVTQLRVPLTPSGLQGPETAQITQVKGTMEEIDHLCYMRRDGKVYPEIPHIATLQNKELRSVNFTHLFQVEKERQETLQRHFISFHLDTV